MNQAMPEQMTDWPSFISRQGDSLHPETVNVVMTNQADRIEFDGRWKLKGLYDNSGNILTDDQLVFTSYINGWQVDETYKSDNGTNRDGHDQGQLWGVSVSPDLRVTKDGVTKYVNLYTQFAIINNNGSILSQSDFTSTSENPFAVLKQVAGEQVIFCREKTGTTTTDFFTRGNLDLIITPDAVIAIAEKLASQIGDIKKDQSAK
jgi:hypothetical protein